MYSDLFVDSIICTCNMLENQVNPGHMWLWITTMVDNILLDLDFLNLNTSESIGYIFSLYCIFSFSNNQWWSRHELYCNVFHLFSIYISEGNVLIVGHAGTVEVCTRQLLGKPHRSAQEFRELCSKVPYCGLLVIEEDKKHKTWKVMDSPISCLTHGQNKIGDVRKLLYPSYTWNIITLKFSYTEEV